MVIFKQQLIGLKKAHNAQNEYDLHRIRPQPPVEVVELWKFLKI